MIQGIGIDVVEVHRFHTVQERSEFIAQYLTSREITEFHPISDSVAATLFAIKEACLKAFGIGLTGGSLWHEMEVSTLFQVVLRGSLEERARALSIKQIHVTYSLSQHYSTACVWLER